VLYFGPAGVLNAVGGQTVALPGGQFASLKLLAAGVNGAQLTQTFKVRRLQNAGNGRHRVTMPPIPIADFLWRFQSYAEIASDAMMETKRPCWPLS